MPQIIDAFSHILPEAFIEEMSELYPTEELSELATADHLVNVDHRLGHMDEYGIDQQVLTLARPSIWQGIDDDIAVEATRIANDTVADITTEDPNRFIAAGTLPRLTEEYINELERCVSDLGMPGVQIFSNVDGKPLDAEEFHPFWSAVDDLDATIWIHPQLHDWHEWIDEYLDHKMLGWPFDTSVAMARLVWSGIMEEYDPDIVTHHMGGMVPFYSERIQKFYDKRVNLREMYPRTELPIFENGPKPQFRKFYGDLAVSGSKSALECGHDFFGADQLVFGGDYPFGPEDGRLCYEDTLAMIETVNLPESEKHAMLSENIKELL